MAPCSLRTLAARGAAGGDARGGGRRWAWGSALVLRGGQVSTCYQYTGRYSHAAGFPQPDSLVPEPGDPQALNRRAYVYNNPLRYRDPSGRWVETVWDVANVGWSLYEVYRDPRDVRNAAALAADVGATVLPFAPSGVGLAVRSGQAARAPVEAAGHPDEAADASRRVAKAARRGSGAPDASGAAHQATEVLGGAKPGGAVEQLPLQTHHFATHKHRKWTPQFAEILQKYTLDPDGSWNKELLPHRGTSPRGLPRVGVGAEA